MNKKLYGWLTLLLISVAVASCEEECEDELCADVYLAEYRLIDRNTNADLVFGPSKMYDNKDVRVFSVAGNDTTYHADTAYRLVLDGYDSILVFNLTVPKQTLFLRLSQTDIDTLTMSYGPQQSKCCTYNGITGIQLNNEPVTPYNGIVNLKK